MKISGKYFALLLLLSVRIGGLAQNANTIFLSEGKIEFEKKLNQYSFMDENDGDWNELQKKTMSKFKLSYFDLSFSHGKTLYKPGREVEEKGPAWWSSTPASENVIYMDLDKDQSVSQKKVFEQVFLIQDSLRNIHWKLTDETKVIAGFNCRRANAIIMDSIYVVAFYTDEILTTGGPESFSGLPGMILGVALPHEHVSWFATKVQAVPVPETQVAAPTKGKKVDNKSLSETMQELAKNWGGGKRVNLYMLFTML